MHANLHHYMYMQLHAVFSYEGRCTGERMKTSVTVIFLILNLILMQIQIHTVYIAMYTCTRAYNFIS